MELSRRKVATTLAILLLSLGFGLLSTGKLSLDSGADRYFTETLKEAALAYAATRGVNAVVSVLKESEVEVSPAGVGVSIAAGQILDPVDDMTERASSILVTAIIALGLQKIAFEIAGVAAFQLIAVVLLLMIPLVWLRGVGERPWLQIMIRACAFLLLIRLLLPLSALVSEGLHSAVFAPGIDEARESLALVSSRYEEMNAFEKGEEDGLFSSIVGKAGSQVESARHAFDHIARNVEQIIGSLLELATLYIALFLIQVLAIPLLSLLLAYGVVKQPLWAGPLRVLDNTNRSG
ncbi:MAG: hypothetical protein ABW082_08025 [Sedimenticola sp.]